MGSTDIPFFAGTRQQQQQQQRQQQQQQSATIPNGHLQQEGHEEEEEEEGERGNGIKETERPCPMSETAERGFLWGWVSYWTYYWASPFLMLGASRTLTEEDLLGISKEQKR